MQQLIAIRKANQNLARYVDDVQHRRINFQYSIILRLRRMSQAN